MRSLIFAFAISLTGAAASGAVDRGPLPPLQLRSLDGAPVAEEVLRSGPRKVLVVVDAGLPGSRSFLGGLSAKGDDLGPAVVIVVIGREQDASALIQAHDALSGATWLIGRGPVVVDELGLPGLPSMLGLDERGVIRWQFTGVPDPAEEAYRRAREWLIP